MTSGAGRAGAGVAGAGVDSGAATCGGGAGTVAWSDFGAAGAVERMAGVSEGAGLSGRDDGLATGGSAGFPADSSWNFARICSTVGESRPAKILDFTSKPHVWIRSSSSWLFTPSSFANSWTRVDNGNSSCGRPVRTNLPRPARSVKNLVQPIVLSPFYRVHRASLPSGLAGSVREERRLARGGRTTGNGPERASWLVHIRISLLGLITREGFRGRQGRHVGPLACGVRLDLLR